MYHTNKENEMKENVFFLKIVNYFNAVRNYLSLESTWIHHLSQNTKAQSWKIEAVPTVGIGVLSQLGLVCLVSPFHWIEMNNMYLSGSH